MFKEDLRNYFLGSYWLPTYPRGDQRLRSSKTHLTSFSFSRGKVAKANAELFGSNAFPFISSTRCISYLARVGFMVHSLFRIHQRHVQVRCAQVHICYPPDMPGTIKILGNHFVLFGICYKLFPVLLKPVFCEGFAFEVFNETASWRFFTEFLPRENRRQESVLSIMRKYPHIN